MNLCVGQLVHFVGQRDFVAGFQVLHVELWTYLKSGFFTGWVREVKFPLVINFLQFAGWNIIVAKLGNELVNIDRQDLTFNSFLRP